MVWSYSDEAKETIKLQQLLSLSTCLQRVYVPQDIDFTQCQAISFANAV